MDEKRHGKLETLTFFGIPLLLTVLLGMLIINFLNIPVWKTVEDVGNKLPLINGIIPGSASVTEKNSDDTNYWKQRFLNTDALLKERDQKITELTKQLSSSQKGIEDLEKSNEKMQSQHEKKQNEEFKNQLKQMAAVYANIPSSKAAAMFDSMPIEDAALTLSQLGHDEKSSILGSMKDPKRAAQITMLMNEIPTIKDTDETSFKKQLHELAQQQETPAEALSETIATMQPAQAAGIIQSMMGTNSQAAIDLVKNVNTNSRSQILTELTKINPKLAAQIAENLNN